MGNDKQMLLLQQFVDVLDIVKRVVDEEAQFGNDAHLVSDACSKFVADGLFVRVDVFYQLLRTVGGEDAQIGSADAQVGRDADTCHRNHHAVHHPRLALEYLGKLLLEKPRNAILSCFLHITLYFVRLGCKSNEIKSNNEHYQPSFL